jgi:hypothetical protein
VDPVRRRSARREPGARRAARKRPTLRDDPWVDRVTGSPRTPEGGGAFASKTLLAALAQTAAAAPEFWAFFQTHRLPT